LYGRDHFMRRDKTNVPALWSMVVFVLILAAGEGSRGTWSRVAMSWLLIGTWGTYFAVRLGCDLMDDEDKYRD